MKLVFDDKTAAMADTIAAIATAQGGALRGVVRISGLGAGDILGRLGTFSPPVESAGRACLLTGTIQLPQGIGPAPVTVYWWPTNKSYTREPCAELHLIGSPPILAAALEAACAAGARFAAPGEFTLRAFLAGRLDLTQAEAVLGVIDAEDRRQLDVALAQLAGGLAQPLAKLRGELLDLLAHLEAGLDFVEEDIEFIAREDLVEQVAALADQVAAIALQLRERGGNGELPRVVLYGLANAGKSSLLNVLAGEDAALVSPQAGTTRDFVSREARIGQRACLLVDTAGVAADCSAGELEQAMQATTRHQSDTADLKLLCIDASRELTDWEWGELAGEDNRRMVVWTKCDLTSHAHQHAGAGFATSSRFGLGLSTLRAAISAALDATHGADGAVAATADRCRDSLRLAGEALRRAAESARSDVGDEIVAAELRSALDELGRVVGAVYTEDILDRVFSRFCIGK